MESAMTDRELRRLGRAKLPELLPAQTRRIRGSSVTPTLQDGEHRARREGHGLKDNRAQRMAGCLDRSRRRRRRRAAISALAAVMVLNTVCPLILPAAALEGYTYCGIEAHEHGQDCYTRVLVCGLEESAKPQEDESGTPQEDVAACGPEESAKPQVRVLICTLEEKESSVHEHSPACYTQERVLNCAQEESADVHTHTESCAATEQRLICADESEEHEHGEGCYETVTTMQCGMEEGAPTGHVHTEGCYITEEKLSCGLEEGAELPGHTHTDACYAAEETTDAAPEEDAENADPAGAGAEETGHTHTEACYTATLTCEKKEHRHELKCFSNPEADVENEEVWARSVSGVTLTGKWDDDLIAIAQSQLGYAESTRNYTVDEHGQISGYSRYGAWYGNAYGDWCAMFASFCLHYAGIPAEAFPYRSACGQWVEALRAEECGLWREREAYTPKKGDMIFFDTDGDGEADHVGIIMEVGLGADGQLERINTIEGNYGDCVQRVEHGAKEEGIVGFGALPENPETDRLRAASTEAAKTVTVTDENGTEATTNEWSPEQSAIDEARKKLDNALVMVGQGYTIRSVEYYEISGLTGSKATVTYSGGGLSAGNAEEVFVYDLGADGTALTRCTVTESTSDAGAGTFSSFSFNTQAEGDGTARVYAFISASHATLEEMGIYLGEQQENGSWVVYDTKNPTEANVKATLTLPVGVNAPESYCPFIRKIREGEGYYPKDEAVLAEAGANNGWQCYTIRWIKQDDSGIHMIPLNENGGVEKLTVQVKIEYLKKEEQLPGPAGGRKLLIFNSLHDGSLADQVADTVENVLVDADSYTSFTFQASHSGPYVFVSKTLEKGYIDSLNLGKEKGIVDGSAPFDSSDTPGNDSGENNRIIRSYDTIQYNLEASFAAREDGIKQKTVDMYFELTLGKSSTAARFDISKMTWLGEKYSIEYLNSNGEVIMVMAHDGKFYQPLRDENGEVCRNEYGFALADTDRGKISINAGVNGSTAGENSYKVASGGVATQRLVGCTTLTAKEGENILSGTQMFPLAVEVRNADNEEVFAPRFKMWLEGNEENYGPETRLGDTLLPATPDTGNVLDISAPGNEDFRVKVSAGTNFNLQLKKNGDMSYKNWFDFATGDAVAESARSELERLAALEENHGKSNPAEFTEQGAELPQDKKNEYANYRYGRMTCYGITLQLYSDTDNKPEENRAAKGLKGMSLPVGEITFDLNFSSTVNANGQTLGNSEYPAILWDYNENIPANIGFTFRYDDPGRGTVQIEGNGLGNGGRRLYWDGESRSAYAKGGGPSNYRDYHRGCYYGGDWSLVDGAGNKAEIGTLANPGAVTGGGTTYHFSVSDYDFDFDGQHFPTQDAGNSGNVPGYGSYAQGFSAGCVQVLSVFPRVQKTSEAELFLNATVSNLKLKTRAGQPLAPREGDDSGYGHEVNQNDNSKSDQIVLYAPGNMTKGNSFNGKQGGQDPKTTAGGFLGTEYWTTSYDCSTFAGDEIWIMSYGMLSSGGDFRTRSMNLLQLFDSRALNIRGKPTLYQEANAQYGEEKGTVCFLYAADPDYPKGYDTNATGMLKYMNTVREEDLRYFTSLNDLQGAGFTCVGVLMELRGCNLLGGKYQYMSIPVKVNGEDETLVGKTVATVNTARVWSTDQGGISWKDGVWNAAEGRNVLAGYNRPMNTVVDGEYSAELANSQTKSPPHYVKTEYQEGLQVQGTHAGGTLSGNSLLILSYKAEIGIGVDKEGGAATISYNVGNGETVVDYRLENIRTVISDLTGQTENPKTTLTINAVLDEGHTGAQRISVAGGSYRMEGYAVDADGNAASEITSIAIGSDPNEPTVLEYVDSDGIRQRIKVYAQMGANSQSVRFVIQDAPVGKQLPDITFQANFAAVTALQNNDTIKTSAYISGTGDNRAYSEAKGNTDNITVSIIMIGGTNLTKAVNTSYIELEGLIEYTVTYTNSGAATIPKIYFYDLMPDPKDIRGSQYDGDVVLWAVDVRSSGQDGVDPAYATVYYSNEEYRKLYDTVKVFGGEEKPDGSIEGMNTDKVEELLASPMFEQLGHVQGGSFVYEEQYDNMSTEELTALMRSVTGLYVKAEDLREGQTIDMIIKMGTENNQAGNWYKNIANSWIADSATTALTSNKVETQTVSRRISGVVWYDKNLNGVRDAEEARLDGVTATLFKQNGTQYEKCTKDVTGAAIDPVTTGTDGVYCFDGLAEGEYIVAFSGAALKKFTGATAYQVRGRNDADTNDGVLNDRATAPGIAEGQYPYFIRYTVSSTGMQMHGIDDMKEGKARLVNGVEAYANQDLGLVTGEFALAETGGGGTALYTAAGLLLMGMAGLLLCQKAKRKGGKA